MNDTKLIGVGMFTSCIISVVHLVPVEWGQFGWNLKWFGEARVRSLCEIFMQTLNSQQLPTWCIFIMCTCGCMSLRCACCVIYRFSMFTNVCTYVNACIRLDKSGNFLWKGEGYVNFPYCILEDTFGIDMTDILSLSFNICITSECHHHYNHRHCRRLVPSVCG